MPKQSEYKTKGKGSNPNSHGNRKKERPTKTISVRVDLEFYELNHVQIQNEIKAKNEQFKNNLK